MDDWYLNIDDSEPVAFFDFLESFFLEIVEWDECNIVRLKCIASFDTAAYFENRLVFLSYLLNFFLYFKFGYFSLLWEIGLKLGFNNLLLLTPDMKASLCRPCNDLISLTILARDYFQKVNGVLLYDDDVYHADSARNIHWSADYIANISQDELPPLQSKLARVMSRIDAIVVQ